MRLARKHSAPNYELSNDELCRMAQPRRGLRCNVIALIVIALILAEP
jgi:hypothetical protein